MSTEEWAEVIGFAVLRKGFAVLRAQVKISATMGQRRALTEVGSNMAVLYRTACQGELSLERAAGGLGLAGRMPGIGFAMTCSIRQGARVIGACLSVGGTRESMLSMKLLHS